MVFSSIFFLLYFLPLFLILYQITNKNYKNYFILFASILFYAWGAPKFVFLLITSTIIDYYLVNTMYNSKEANIKKLLLGLSISLNVGLLLYFKYANFFIENVNLLLESNGVENVSWTKVALPIGISFYTFQTLTYSIDVYRKAHAPLKKLSNYLLYIMSFPQMIAGPIVRFKEIADQIEERKETTADKLQGFIRFCIGLGKKVLIANVMGEQADLILGQQPENLSGMLLWTGMIAYSFQIYFDFSGYSDMAIGLGKMMGFSFPENFNHPYTSKSISEFWRRWHITLGVWMRDYLYIPLGGNRVSTKFRLYSNLWFVFLISGFWHGASWNFLIWGAFHGLFLILDRILLDKLLNKVPTIFRVLLTFALVVIGWVFFRIEEFEQATKTIGQMFHFSDFKLDFETIPSFKLIFIIALFFSFIHLTIFGKKICNWVFFNPIPNRKWYLIMLPISFCLLLLSIARISAQGFNPFIYFRF
mgnify:CR=1 FL=1